MNKFSENFYMMGIDGIEDNNNKYLSSTPASPAGFGNLTKRQQTRYLNTNNPSIIGKSDAKDIINEIDLSVENSNKKGNDEIINEEKNKDNTMVTAMIGAASQAVQGLTGIASGLIGQRKRNADARAAKCGHMAL